MATINPYDVLFGPKSRENLDIATMVPRNRMLVAQQNEARGYQEMMRTRQREERKSDEDEAITRRLRTQLAGLLKPGEVIPDGLSDEQLSMRINEATREQGKRYSDEDFKTKLARIKEELAFKSQAEMDQEADAWNVPQNLSPREKRERVADAKAREQVRVGFVQLDEQVNKARTHPEYEKAKQGLILLEQMKADILQDAKPDSMKAGFAGDESKAMYKAVAETPQVKMVFSQYSPKDVDERLTALSEGNVNAALGDLDPGATQSVVDALSSRFDQFQEQLARTGVRINSDMLRNYQRLIDDIPVRLRQVDAERQALFNDPAIGRALRLDAQTIVDEWKKTQGPIGPPAPMPGTGGPMGALPPKVPVNPVAQQEFQPGLIQNLATPMWKGVTVPAAQSFAQAGSDLADLFNLGLFRPLVGGYGAPPQTPMERWAGNVFGSRVGDAMTPENPNIMALPPRPALPPATIKW